MVTKKKSPVTKVTVTKTVVRRAKPLTTKSVERKPERIQTAEGWRRSMLRSRKG